MTDLALAPDLPQAPDLEPAQIAAMREQWVGLGLDPLRFDAAASGLPEPAERAPDLSQADGPVTADTTVMAMVEGLREAGVPEADITAALAADGYTLAPADTRTEEQREHDAVWGGAKPDAYRIDYMGRLAGQQDVTALAGLDSEARAWLSEIGFPANIGPSVVEAALDARNRLVAMSEPQRQLWATEQRSLFAQVAGGPERAAERMTLAAKALARGRAGFTDALSRCGALNDATVVSLLALQGERVTVRERTSERADTNSATSG